MRKKQVVIAVVAVFGVLLAARSSRAVYDIGDKARPLRVKEWVRGDPVDPTKGDQKKLHLVEFWATWCPPCKASIPLLSELQATYKDDLVIIGVTDPDNRGNTVKAIRRFVKRQGDNMSYRVAIDDRGKTSEAYMMAAGAMGIPHAFLIDRSGKMVWQGSPLDPVLPQVLQKAIDGSYDVASARVEKEVMQRLQALSFSIEMGQWAKVWDGLVDILKLDPANEVGLDALYNIYARELRNTKTFRKWVKSHIAANKNNGAAMRQLALTLLNNSDYTTRVPDLALEAARAAYEASGDSNAAGVELYARALFQIGDLDRAIALQRDAVALNDSPGRVQSEKTLKYYALCKQLRSESN